MPSAQDYASRLLQEARSILSLHLAGLEKELQNLQAQMATSLTQIDQSLGPIRAFELPAAEGVVLEAINDAVHRRDMRLASLAHLANDIRQKETQEEILTLLMDGARS